VIDVDVKREDSIRAWRLIWHKQKECSDRFSIAIVLRGKRNKKPHIVRCCFGIPSQHKSYDGGSSHSEHSTRHARLPTCTRLTPTTTTTAAAPRTRTGWGGDIRPTRNARHANDLVVTNIARPCRNVPGLKPRPIPVRVRLLVVVPDWPALALHHRLDVERRGVVEHVRERVPDRKVNSLNVDVVLEHDDAVVCERDGRVEDRFEPGLVRRRRDTALIKRRMDFPI